ncbi:MAG: hypothetical protein ACLT8H_04035 [Streptococcus parasanguinis]
MNAAHAVGDDTLQEQSLRLLGAR